MDVKGVEKEVKAEVDRMAEICRMLAGRLRAAYQTLPISGRVGRTARSEAPDLKWLT